MIRFLSSFLVLALAFPGAAAEPAPGLEIHFIDTEGGAATLIITPAGESVLIDCGNPGRATPSASTGRRPGPASRRSTISSSRTGTAITTAAWRLWQS